MAPSLHWFPVSPFARNVKYFLVASNIEHESKIVNLMTGEQKSEEYKKINPHQKVPALLDGDLNLYESLAIIRYLAFKYSSPLLPYHQGPEAVARIDRDAEFINGTVSKTVNLLVYEKVFKVKFGRGELEPATIERLEGELKTHLTAVNDGFFQNPHFVIGDSLSLVDVLFTVALTQASIAQVDFSGYPKIVAYFENAKTQVAFQQSHAEFFAILQQLAGA